MCEFAYANDSNAVSSRALVQDETVFVPLEKDGDLIQLELTADFLLNSATPLQAYADADEVQKTRDIPLPDLYPIKHTITLEKENIYQLKHVFRKFLSFRLFLLCLYTISILCCSVQSYAVM